MTSYGEGTSPLYYSDYIEITMPGKSTNKPKFTGISAKNLAFVSVDDYIVRHEEATSPLVLKFNFMRKTSELWLKKTFLAKNVHFPVSHF